jgi:Uma2 family endonuclease
MVLNLETRLWTTGEYLRMSDLGILSPDERVELVEGVIVKMAAHGNRHSMAIIRANEALVLALHDTHGVACQVTLIVSERSCFEPDFNMVRKSTLNPNRRLHDGDLVVEVSYTSLNFDRRQKASLYARKGLEDYWVSNLKNETVEVYRDPQADPAAPFGFRYTSKTVYQRGEVVSPLCRPDVSIAVDDLLHPPGTSDPDEQPPAEE